jgi:small subunit ribosomal protein S17
MTGKVIKDKMHKTVVVECVDYSRDALYGKYVKQRSRFKAHDETNQYKVGDEVEIQEHRPISREKRFIVVRLVKKFVEE